MAELRTLLTDSGYADVTTHLQSGNVIVAAADESETVLARRTQTKLRRRFGFEIPVIVRSSAALADVLAADPLGEVATDPARYIVTFLDSKPSAAAVRALELEDFDAEQFTVRGREVYQWCPGGQHKSPLVKALDKAGITATGTARNWRTVQRLAEMVRPNR
jgi:uncharacterized protein (DUF1697 family)